MNVEPYRPRVQDLVFHLYTRPVHPELFETLAVRRVQRGDYVLVVSITPAGHVLSWSRQGFHLTEITATRGQVLPSSGARISHRFEGERNGSIHPTAGLSYQMCSQVEILPPEIFLHVHEEILADGRKRGLLYAYPAHHRLALAPLGWVTVEENRHCLSVASFHTFPDELTVVKTQSIIERES